MDEQTYSKLKELCVRTYDSLKAWKELQKEIRAYLKDRFGMEEIDCASEQFVITALMEFMKMEQELEPMRKE